MKHQIVLTALADILGSVKSYNIPSVCIKYNLGNGKDYSEPHSKTKYFYNLIKDKDPAFILDLANTIVEDFQSDFVGRALNEYYEGKYFKLSEITRRNIITDICKINDLNGNISIDDFLKQCNLESIKPAPQYKSFFDLVDRDGNTDEILDINSIVLNAKLHEILDEKFFKFLEVVIHPNVRLGEDRDKYIHTINEHLRKDSHLLSPVFSISGHAVYKVIKNSGHSDVIKNIIFASNGYKPEIVLEDALSNTIKIVKHEETCLIYNRPLDSSGLLWVDLVKWWADMRNIERNIEVAQELRNRLFASLASEPEKVFFNTYFKNYSKKLGTNLPALIPQVYLHYDPYSIQKYGIQYLTRQRMDFLLLLPNNTRVVLEIDGVQHYSENEKPSPKKYAVMVSLDRDLKLLGYEVYRFGGFETTNLNEAKIIDFFNKLFERHEIK